MNALEAQRVIESLRKGIPPDGHVCEFTVGRYSEIESLIPCFRSGKPGALLLKANYGAGKTHLLRFLCETALKEGFAASYISLDSRSAVRFDLMDRIFGAVVRNIECPNHPDKGPAALFSAVHAAMRSACSDTKSRSRLAELSSAGRWDYSSTLNSPAMYVGLRAWIIGTTYPDADDVIAIPREVEAWLEEPWNYYGQTVWLYRRFVDGLRPYFRDPRPSWFGGTLGDVFVLKRSDFRQAWDALGDLNLLAQLAGLKGLVILVDEFEDVIYNLRGPRRQLTAFWNLFRLFDGDFPGFSFYGVTPGFVEKCKQKLMSKWVWDYDYSRFDSLPSFAMSPLTEGELLALAERIAETHGVAYSWTPRTVLGSNQLRSLVHRAALLQIEDRSRYAIREVVKALDACLEELD